MRKRQIWKPFTVMVIPHSGEQVRSVSISKTLIAFCAALIFLMCAGGGFFVYKFIEYRRFASELDAYKAESQQIQKEYNAIVGTVEHVKEKLNVMQQLENDLREKNGLPPHPDEQADKGGQGGELQSRNGLMLPYMVLNKDAVAALDQEADEQIESAQHTLAVVIQQEKQKAEEEKRKQEQLARTPSIWPTGFRRITSNFGYRSDPFGGFNALHTGLDIAGDYGSPIQATADGIVELAGWDGGYGNSVVISHGNGLSTRYGHMSDIKVKVGQTVKKGETIGLMGSTGRSTGTHVHYEILKNGVPVNPISYLP